MIQTGGLTLLFAWLIFAALLATLGYLILGQPADPLTEARRRTDEQATPSARGDPS
jgi:hypothetical protein